MATIRKRNGLYQAQVRKRGYPGLSRTFATKPEALRWATECELEMLSGGTPKQRSRVPFSKALDDYLSLRCDWTVTGASRTASVAKRARRELGEYYLDNLTPKILCDWRDELLASGLSNQTVRHHLGLVSVVYSKAIRHFHTYEGDNPVQRMEKPSVAHTGRTRVVTPEEVNLITSGLAAPLRAFVLIGYETAMRRGEIERIERHHLSVNGGSYTLLIPLTKTGKPRTIPVSPSCVEWIQQLLAGTDKATVLGDFAYRAFAREAKRHGIEGVVFHSLRHSAITNFFQRGLQAMEVAAISGHTTLQMLSRYSHISTSHLSQKLGYV